MTFPLFGADFVPPACRRIMGEKPEAGNSPMPRRERPGTTRHDGTMVVSPERMLYREATLRAAAARIGKGDEMTLSIYGIAQSRAFRTLWTALELGIDYEHVQIGFSDGAMKSASFLAVNPNGRIPAIKDGDFVLWESLAINLYLAKKHGRGLYPASLDGEATTWQWSFWGMSEIEQPLMMWAYNTIVLPAEQRDAAKAAEGLASLKAPLQVLEQSLSGRSFLLGDAFTVADLNLASIMFRARSLDLSASPNVKRWLERCYARPAAVAAVKLRG
jgi:glutathione S-transferase